MAGIDEATPDDAQAFHFSTDAYREHERIPAWREVFGRTMLRLDFVPQFTEGFRATATGYRSAALGVMRTSTSPTHQGNSRSLISNDDVSFIRVLSCRATASQLGRSADLEPGDGVFMSHGDVGETAFQGECDYVALVLPKSALAPLVPDIGALVARRVPASNPALRLLLRYLDVAQDDHVAGDPGLQTAFSDHVYDLLALALGATRDAAEQARGRGLPDARLRAMKDDIRKYCNHPDLSIHSIATRHGVSARYVQRVFEESGSTFTQHLTEQRLAAAYKALRRRASIDVPISTVAYDCGFSDVSHFNRVFRRRFGCTPSDVRSAPETTDE
jgi:AraC-like DNA-binding protein